MAAAPATDKDGLGINEQGFASPEDSPAAGPGGSSTRSLRLLEQEEGIEADGENAAPAEDEVALDDLDLTNFSEMTALPPLQPPPPRRLLYTLSTIRREPKWAMGGRGGEKVIQFFNRNLVRARIMSSRPVPPNEADPTNYMTHKIEYITGGKGQEWAILDEKAKTIRMKAALPPPSFSPSVSVRSATGLSSPASSPAHRSSLGFAGSTSLREGSPSSTVRAGRSGSQGALGRTGGSAASFGAAGATGTPLAGSASPSQSQSAMLEAEGLNCGGESPGRESATMAAPGMSTPKDPLAEDGLGEGEGEGEGGEGGEAAEPSEPELVAPPGWWIARYTDWESVRNQEPAPGQYGIVNVDCRFTKSPSASFGGRRTISRAFDQASWERELIRQERRERGRAVCEENARAARGPDLTAYSTQPSWGSPVPKNPKKATTGFGTTSRSAGLKPSEGPEPGAYDLTEKDKSRMTIRRRVGGGGKSLEDYRSRSAPGLEPLAYDVDKSMRMTIPKEPAWRIRAESKRSGLATAPSAPGPGSYNVSHKLTLERSPAAQYNRRPPSTRLRKRHEEDPHMGYFTLFG
mmetsp:Transcript_30894/g.65465  ORF Transcript_30894/g.65465 Transcript_30894/m.65465 type:complete len:576 (-) Transcript_30894:193-1920(-)|eukprot:CAMPEP_0206560844 /NCGR_PEP_ID=MMETSP0325_2-20121206/21260_1 /ASSEMBLY_ACC=CAM_ASM_000347 /TAXON_ID=2866 /ORGANISM="Crypthecodinium cohnii, Strain Seligo" /LENGTH=575 /DNA_ID=CAMNT_0054062671 /DNA_START=129 /DNA_END=1856 /DNA_ORIENTATION=-